ncbi:hypothetical protein FNV43_RR26796 [Rhamnella rubrinervis]|uniref:acid phosphatase n=1 Tax=Rhamnella rubrinervis TaxID=2594499 RepID=A0A8K0GJZ6_9ROSA|nr:hypothetical protein FNV43_RR26796 [Rhamnella rubrinervis]
MASQVMRNKKTMSETLIFSCVILCLLWVLSTAELQRFQHGVKEDGSLSLLVVGDWGRRGSYNQSEVALQMGIIGEKLDIDFVISTGDNFYEDGLTGVDDSAFDDSFTKIYTAPSLQKQWYNVLGNHDYRGDVEAQLSSVLKKIDSRWLCLRSFILDTEIAEFFFVDTTPFVNSYFTDPEDHVYDWRGILPRKAYLSNLLKDVDSALKKSTAKWKFVVGHHTMKSAGHHGNTQEIVDQLLPILEANQVDLYINGHDHLLQQISSLDSPLQFLTSGGGSKAWRGDVSKWDPKEMKFFYDGQGFMSMQITPTRLDIAFYDVFGQIKLMNYTASWLLAIEEDARGLLNPFKLAFQLETTAQLSPILQRFGQEMALFEIIPCYRSGGGSKTWRGDIKWWKPEELKLYSDGQGFMSVQMSKEEANIEFYDVFGNVLHHWKLSKGLDSVA